jgi:hypothetical protein
LSKDDAARFLRAITLKKDHLQLFNGNPFKLLNPFFWIDGPLMRVPELG